MIQVAALLAVLALAAGAVYDALWLHPGFSLVDEAHAVAFVRAFIDGQGLPFSFGTGALTRTVQALLGSLGQGQLWLLRLPIWGAILAELWLLWVLGRRVLGPRAAAGAVLVCALSGLSLLRTHSLLSFALLPAAQLLLLWLYLDARRWAWVAAGALAGLWILDYEAWPLALLGLAAFVGLTGWDRVRAQNFMLGLLPALALVWALSAENLASWWAWRSARELAPLSAGSFGALQRLSGFFLGGMPSISYLGLDGAPAWPWWALAPLLYGAALAWRRAPGLLLWSGIGLLGLLPHANALEPNRAIAAWPALCLLAGLGLEQSLSWIEERLDAAPAGLLLGLVLLCAGVIEWSAFQSNQAKNQQGYYVRSAAWIAAAQELGPSARTGQALVLSGFDKTGHALRYMLGEKKRSLGSAQAWLLLPQGLLKDAPLKGLLRLDARDPLEIGRESLVVVPTHSALAAAEAQARAIELSLPAFDTLAQRRLLRAELDRKGQPALLRNWLWWRWAGLAGPVGAIGAEDLVLLSQESFQGGLAYVQVGMQLMSRNPEWAFAVLDRGLQRDPQALLPPGVLRDLQRLRAAHKVPPFPKAF